MKKHSLILGAFLFFGTAQAQTLHVEPVVLAPAASAQGEALRTSTFSAAAGTMASGTHILHGTAGQIGIGTMENARFKLGGGFWHEVRSTIEPAPPAAPFLIEPADGAVDQPLTVQLVWQEMSGALSYDVQIDTEETFEPPVAGEAAGLTGAAVEVRGLAPGTTYFWRVRAVGAAGPGPYASVYRFMTAINTASDDEAALPERFALKANYPNPFNPSTAIGYDLSAPAEVSLAVYDVFGRAVKTLVRENQQAGRYVVAFNAGTLASGVYFYHLQAGAFKATRKMLLTK